MKLGARYPLTLLGPDTKPLAHYLQAVEELGYDYISGGDHVLGAERTSRPNWRPYFGKPALFDHTSPFHEPFVLFGFLAAITKRLELCTSILILGQRQTALVAKQAAEIDVLSGGRLRLVVAVGWNDVEYEALGVPFEGRGERIEEQLALLRALWTKEVVTFKGKFHTVTAAGINPLPIQRPIPLWIGGSSAPVLRRVGRLGDGWYPAYTYFNPDLIRRDIETIRVSARQAGRDPSKIGIGGSTFFHDVRFEQKPGDRLPPKNVDEAVVEAQTWKALGATHYSVSVGPGNDEVAANARRAMGAAGSAPTSPSSSDASRAVDAQLEVLRKFKELAGRNC